MEDSDESRQRLARAIRGRRVERGLSVASAARKAGIDRGTWKSAEDGARETEDYIYGSIERALDWQAGSVEAILGGGEPTPLDETSAPDRRAAGESALSGSARGERETVDEWHARVLSMIRNDPDLQSRRQELESLLRSTAVQYRVAEAEQRAAEAERRVLEERMRNLQERSSA